MSVPGPFARFFTRSALYSLLVILITSAQAMAQAAPPHYDDVLKQMLEAIRSNSYEQFTARGDDRFKAGFTNKMFTDWNKSIGKRLQQGYTTTFLTTMKQRDYVVYVFKLSFKDQKDDVLISLFVSNGKISGFVSQ